MTAIWPAGPPKLSAATRAQTFIASENGIPCSLLTLLVLLLLGRPIVSFADRVAAPAIERIVQAHAGLELLEIVGNHLSGQM